MNVNSSLNTMIHPISQSDVLMYSTVRICGETKTGEIVHGTGFFMQMSKEVGDRLLITNWHVVEDLRSIRFLMHRSPQVYDASKSSKFVEINLKDAQRRWIRHPDPVVDLC